MIELGGFVRDIYKLNRDSRNFRIFGPDETMSNRLGRVFEETNRDWNAETVAGRRVPGRRRPRDGLHAVRASCARAGWRAIC